MSERTYFRLPLSDGEVYRLAVVGDSIVWSDMESLAGSKFDDTISRMVVRYKARLEGPFDELV